MKSIRITISKDGYSLIKAKILLGKEWRDGYFIIDTGSSRSLIVGTSGLNFRRQETINGISDKESYGKTGFTKIDISETIFPFGCLEIKQQQMPKVEYTTLGIIGVDFLLKNKIVVDYNKIAMYQSYKKSLRFNDGSIGAIKMNLGLKEYGVPVMASVKDGQCCFLIADTGSIMNIISEKISSLLNIPNVDYSDMSLIEGINGTITIARRLITLRILMQQDGKTIPLVLKDVFGIKQSKGSLLGLDSANYEIDGIIGNKLLLNEGWVFDFCNKIMFPTEIRC